MACHATFTGEKPFVRHRRGPITQRRCADPAEMAGLGLRLDERGRWYCPVGVKRRTEPAVTGNAPLAA